MYYLYHIRLNNYLFYIGCTTNPVRRYKEHYHDQISACYKLLRFWINHDKRIAKMHIIDVFDNKQEAFRAEYKAIQLLRPPLNDMRGGYLIQFAIPKIEKVKTHDLLKDEIENIKAQLQRLCKPV